MLSLIKLILKISVVGAVAIFLGHFITIDGMTLNDRMGIFAEKSKQATITRDVQRWAHQLKQPLNSAIAPQPAKEEDSDEVDTYEQERLKALLKKTSKHR